jgi:hypothetical protein
VRLAREIDVSEALSAMERLPYAAVRLAREIDVSESLPMMERPPGFHSSQPQ